MAAGAVLAAAWIALAAQVIPPAARSGDLVKLGAAREARNDLPGALDAYSAAVRADSNDAVARDRLGFLLRRLAAVDEALAEFHRAILLDPNLFDAQYHLGATRWWRRDFQGAVGALRAAVRLRPTHAEARYYLGITLRQLGDAEAGVEQLREAVRLAPTPAPTRRQRG